MASKKWYPVERKFRVNEVLNLSRTTTKLICVNDLLSRVNKRLYRQGRYYHVRIHIDGDSTASHRVFTLRNTWDVQKAYQMAYKQYLDNTKEERARLGKGQIARWEDFKIDSGFDFTSVPPTPVGPNWADYMEPLGFNVGNYTGTSYTIGENTVFSKVVDSSGAEKTFTWVSPAPAGQYSVLAEYQNAANTQNSPSSATTNGPYEELNSEVNAATMDSLQDDGNAPPYAPADNAVDRIFTQHQLLTSRTTGVQRLSTGFICAPCGYIVVTSDSDDVPRITVEVQAGDYKGVNAPSMLE